MVIFHCYVSSPEGIHSDIWIYTHIFLPTTSGCAKLSLEVEIAVFFCVSEKNVSSLEEAGQEAKIDWVSYQGKWGEWGEWGKWRISDTVTFRVGACNCISQSLSQSISQWYTDDYPMKIHHHESPSPSHESPWFHNQALRLANQLGFRLLLFLHFHQAAKQR